MSISEMSRRVDENPPLRQCPKLREVELRITLAQPRLFGCLQGHGAYVLLARR
jgi:hypothetical protein